MLMNRVCRHEVQVEIGKRSVPAAFTWGGRTHHIIQVQECWRLTGAWWDGEGEYTFFRVHTREGGFYELCYDHRTRRWKLTVVQD